MKTWQPITIETEDKKLTSKFGISDKRVDELEEIVDRSIKDNNYISDSIEQATGECNNINEAIVVTYMMGIAKGSEYNDIEDVMEDIAKTIEKELGAKYIGSFRIKRNDDEES